MRQIKWARRQSSRKAAIKKLSAAIIVDGPYGSGLTTFFGATADIYHYKEGRIRREHRQRDSAYGYDHARIKIDDDIILYLFGIDRLTWNDLEACLPIFNLDICIGWIILVDVTQPETFAAIRQMAAACETHLPLPYLVAANHASQLDADLHTLLGLPPHTLVVPCEAVERESVKQVIITLMHKWLDRN